MISQAVSNWTIIGTVLILVVFWPLMKLVERQQERKRKIRQLSILWMTREGAVREAIRSYIHEHADEGANIDQAIEFFLQNAPTLPDPDGDGTRQITA